MINFVKILPYDAVFQEAIMVKTLLVIEDSRTMQKVFEFTFKHSDFELQFEVTVFIDGHDVAAGTPGGIKDE